MKKALITFAVLCVASANAAAQNWNPRFPGWQDSYEVGGRCYCDSSNFDHNLDEKSADTPIGRLNVVRICEDIEEALGTGSTNGRIPYNDIQCGNGPANDAPDETGCPGRVDIGNAGCNVIGPKWDLEAVYGDGGNNTPTLPSTPVSGTTASNNANDARLAVDGNANTRWTTRTPQRPGQYFQLDLGQTRTIGKVTLDSSRSPNDEPAGYSLSTSTNGSNFQVAATGSGQSNGNTEINFTDRSARYVRITQTGSKNRNWWSIHQISVSEGSDGPNDNDNGGSDGDALNRNAWTLVASNANSNTHRAIDGSTSSRWSTRQKQQNGQWLEIDLSRSESFSRIVLDSEASPNDYPRQYRLRVSNNGSNWRTVESGTGRATTNMTFNTETARYIRIEQSGSDNRFWWSIHEVNIFR